MWNIAKQYGGHNMSHHWNTPKRPPYYFTISVTLHNYNTNDEIVILDKVWDEYEHLIDDVVFRLIESYLYRGYKATKVLVYDYKFVYHEPKTIYS